MPEGQVRDNQLHACLATDQSHDPSGLWHLPGWPEPETAAHLGEQRLGPEEASAGWAIPVSLSDLAGCHCPARLPRPLPPQGQPGAGDGGHSDQCREVLWPVLLTAGRLHPQDSPVADKADQLVKQLISFANTENLRMRHP